MDSCYYRWNISLILNTSSNIFKWDCVFSFGIFKRRLYLNLYICFCESSIMFTVSHEWVVYVTMFPSSQTLYSNYSCYVICGQTVLNSVACVNSVSKCLQSWQSVKHGPNVERNVSSQMPSFGFSSVTQNAAVHYMKPHFLHE